MIIKVLENDQDGTYYYNYKCYAKIVQNALSAGLLDLKYLNEIIALNQRRNQEMPYTNTLMLLYGAALKRSKNFTEDQKTLLQDQKGYLKYLEDKYRLQGSEDVQATRKAG